MLSWVEVIHPQDTLNVRCSPNDSTLAVGSGKFLNSFPQLDSLEVNRVPSQLSKMGEWEVIVGLGILCRSPQGLQQKKMQTWYNTLNLCPDSH